MKKSAQVVMLPTNEKANIVLKKNNELVILPTGHIGTNPSKLTQPQHLYILSDEEIKEGDWFIMNSCIVRQCSLHKGDILDTIGGLHHESVCKKIIATTDKSLKQEIFGLGETAMCSLPQPSTSFIEKFVEEYNKGNVITEVMVEYKSIGAYANPKYDSDYQLKINPDNTINISMPKDSWSREEVTTLLYSLNRDKEGNFDCTKWIEENL